VLVIDDSNTIRRSAEIFLKQGGHEVMLAEDGFDALSKVNDYEPNLIFCDILMPRLDGYQTCAIIKRNAKFAGVPGGHAVLQGRRVRQGARPHGRLAGLPDQAFYQGPAAADRAAVRQRQTRRSDDGHPKVLVVDDSKTELMFMTDLLQKNGFAVKTAENAEDAFRRLAEDKPDLILMDVVMPGQNGFQLTRAITRDPLYSDVPHHHVHQQEPGNRPGLGHAPGRARLHHQAGGRRRADGQDQGPGLNTA
jgi:CheY-like chemotaxis protein